MSKSTLMDQMVVREKFEAALGDQRCSVELGVGGDDPFLYVSLNIEPTDEIPGFGSLLLEFGICESGEDEVRFKDFPNKLRRLADEIEKNILACLPVHEL